MHKSKYVVMLAVALVNGLLLAASPALAAKTKNYYSNGNSPIGTGTGIMSGKSSNWSGYAATGGTYTSIGATWTVPTVSSGGAAYDATWVGIGGISGQDLIQAGTNAEVSPIGGVQYGAWIETLPQASRPIPMAIKAGDSITVDITQQPSKQWLINIKNNTTGKKYSQTLSYNSSLSSAEWIEEIPSNGYSLVSLDNFGSVQFSNAWTVKNGNRVNIADSGAKLITMMTRGGQVAAQPSQIDTTGTSFVVTQSQVDVTTSSSSPWGDSSQPGFPGFPFPGGNQIPTGGLSGFPGMPGGMSGFPGGNPGMLPGGLGGFPGGNQPGFPGGMSGFPGFPGGYPGMPTGSMSGFPGSNRVMPMGSQGAGSGGMPMPMPMPSTMPAPTSMPDLLSLLLKNMSGGSR